MIIAVNTRLLLKDKLEGLGWFTYETLKRIVKDHPEHRFIFFFDRPYDNQFVFADNITPVVLQPQARHPLLWYLFFEWSIPKALIKYKADVFLSTDGWVSLSSKIKTIDVIHDINFEYYPEHIKWLVRQYYHYFFPRFARKADRIATVSCYSKGTIIEKYKIPEDKIDVIYNGAGEQYKPVPAESQEKIRIKYANGNRYFIFVGLLHPRKNIANLFRAYETFRHQHHEPVKLLIVGEKKWWKGEMEQVYRDLEFRDDVIFTGRLQADELNLVMASALALVYVSIFEGFGIPIIEAMQSGVPVITSNVTAMPEIAGDAALLADPFSPNSIADQMKRMATDEKLREQLISKGLIRCKDFSWQKTADGLWNSIEKVMY
jgi:glycosyltransferase involved in cell wall biosynthesis